MSAAKQQRTPTITKPVGTEFKSIAELRAKAEQSQKSNKVPHYTPKKKVILLPGRVGEPETPAEKP